MTIIYAVSSIKSVPLLTGHSGSLNGPSGLGFGTANSLILSLATHFCAALDTTVCTCL